MLKLYNTLTRKKETFKPIKAGNVGMYTCGPTVYWYQHIGNFRSMLLSDFVKRVLNYNDYKVNHVMNFTDVDDKTIKSSIKEGLSLGKLTKKYEDIFVNDLENLNIIKPGKFMRATENIDEMVKIIQKLLKKEYAYTASDGIYFSISKFKGYGKIAGLHKIKNTKERIRGDEYDKAHARDFALWKFHTSDDGEVFWETSVGRGRPGWHIECSAMSMKTLGDTFDIHTGGMDLVFPHHTNEIAQSEAFTGKKFVNYWVHGGMLNLKEGKMSKSLGNIYTLSDLKKEGFQPLHYRYLCLQSHYRKPLEFSFESLQASKNAYEKIERKVIVLRKEKISGKTDVSDYEKRFVDAINDDLNMPKALEVFFSLLDDLKIDTSVKLKLLEKFDNVFGLGISNMKETKNSVPKEVVKLAIERENARKNKDWIRSDSLRNEIAKLGFSVEDTSDGYKLRAN